MLDNFSLQILEHEYSRKENEYFDNKQFFSLSKPVPLPPNSDNENEQSVNTINNHGSRTSSIENSDMASSIWLSSFTSNSKEQSVVSGNESRPSPKKDESGKRI